MVGSKFRLCQTSRIEEAANSSTGQNLGTSWHDIVRALPFVCYRFERGCVGDSVHCCELFGNLTTVSFPTSRDVLRVLRQDGWNALGHHGSTALAADAFESVRSQLMAQTHMLCFCAEISFCVTQILKLFL